MWGGGGALYKSYIELILFSAEKMRIMCELHCPDFLSAVPAGLRGVVDETIFCLRLRVDHKQRCCLKLTLWTFYGQHMLKQKCSLFSEGLMYSLFFDSPVC